MKQEKRILDLIEKINDHNYKYYVLDDPIISDGEFDNLFKELETLEKKLEELIKKIDEKWSDKYKKSIDCSNPKGFSQKAHCAGRKKRK